MPGQHTPGHLAMPTPKSVVLWLFLDGLGIHRFYLNRRHGLTILLLTLAGVVTSPFGIGPLLLFLVFGWVREHNSQLPHG